MPTAVELIANLGAVVVQLPASVAHVATPAPTLGGRSSVASFQAASHKAGAASNPAQSAAAELRPSVPQITSALHGALPANQKMIEAYGIGTDLETVNALIGLLKAQGYHATISSVSAAHRPGFSGPTAVLRGHGGAVPNVFLQQVASSL